MSTRFPLPYQGWRRDRNTASGSRSHPYSLIMFSATGDATTHSLLFQSPSDWGRLLWLFNLTIFPLEFSAPPKMLGTAALDWPVFLIYVHLLRVNRNLHPVSSPDGGHIVLISPHRWQCDSNMISPRSTSWPTDLSLSEMTGELRTAGGRSSGQSIRVGGSCKTICSSQEFPCK